MSKIKERIKKTCLYSYQDLPPELQEILIKYALIMIFGTIITVASIPAFWSAHITFLLLCITVIILISILFRFFQICRGEYFFLVTTIIGKEKKGPNYVISFSYDDKDYTALISNKAFQMLQPGYTIKIYAKSSSINTDNVSSFILKYPTYIFIIKDGKTWSINLF